MNYIIFILILIIMMLMIWLAQKLLGKTGLTIIYVITSLLSLILSFKYIMLSTINVNANSVTYVTMLTSLYLLLETTNKKEVKKIINLNILSLIIVSISLYMTSYHVQSMIDTISINMKNVFIDNSRILIIYPISIALSHYLLITIYKKMRDLYDIPFINTVTSYLLIGLIEAIIFFFGSYLNLLEIKIIIKLLLSSYMIRLIITIIYSLYLTKLNDKKVKK